jgi:hypothetical protein
VDLAPQCMGDLLFPLGPQFQITKHLRLVVLLQRAKFFCGCFEFEALKVELDPKSVGDLIIPPGPQFQVTKHLNLVFLFHRTKFYRRCFEFEV